MRRTTSTPIRIELTAEAANNAAVRRYFLLLPTIGSLRVNYSDRECTLAAGDFVLLDTWTPSVVEIDALNESITVGMLPRSACAGAGPRHRRAHNQRRRASRSGSRVTKPSELTPATVASPGCRQLRTCSGQSRCTMAFSSGSS